MEKNNIFSDLIKEEVKKVKVKKYTTLIALRMDVDLHTTISQIATKQSKTKTQIMQDLLRMGVKEYKKQEIEKL